MGERRYTKQKRARQEARTRQRIVEATAALHGAVGPRQTTISAVAQRAGVQRLTVYRHFPDQEALFRACTSHWLAAHPPPDPRDWADVGDPAARTRAALGALYRYYRATAGMWHLSYRDVEEVPALQEPMREFEEYLDGIRDDLATAWSDGGRPGPALRAVLGHATRFAAWESLAGRLEDDAAIADLVVAWAAAVREGADVGVRESAGN